MWLSGSGHELRLDRHLLQLLDNVLHGTAIEVVEESRMPGLSRKRMNLAVGDRPPTLKPPRDVVSARPSVSAVREARLGVVRVLRRVHFIVAAGVLLAQIDLLGSQEEERILPLAQYWSRFWLEHGAVRHPSAEL